MRICPEGQQRRRLTLLGLFGVLLITLENAFLHAEVNLGVAAFPQGRQSDVKLLNFGRRTAFFTRQALKAVLDADQSSPKNEEGYVHQADSEVDDTDTKEQARKLSIIAARQPNPSVADSKSQESSHDVSILVDNEAQEILRPKPLSFRNHLPSIHEEGRLSTTSSSTSQDLLEPRLMEDDSASNIPSAVWEDMEQVRFLTLCLTWPTMSDSLLSSLLLVCNCALQKAQNDYGSLDSFCTDKQGCPTSPSNLTQAVAARSQLQTIFREPCGDSTLALAPSVLNIMNYPLLPDRAKEWTAELSYIFHTQCINATAERAKPSVNSQEHSKILIQFDSNSLHPYCACVTTATRAATAEKGAAQLVQLDDGQVKDILKQCEPQFAEFLQTPAFIPQNLLLSSTGNSTASGSGKDSKRAAEAHWLVGLGLPVAAALLLGAALLYQFYGERRKYYVLTGSAAS